MSNVVSAFEINPGSLTPRGEPVLQVVNKRTKATGFTIYRDEPQLTEKFKSGIRWSGRANDLDGDVAWVVDGVVEQIKGSGYVPWVETLSVYVDGDLVIAEMEGFAPGYWNEAAITDAEEA